MKDFRLKWTPYGHQGTGRTGYHARCKQGALTVTPMPGAGYKVFGPSFDLLGTRKTAAEAIRLAESAFASKRNPRAPTLASYGTSRVAQLAEVAALRKAGKVQEAYALLAAMKRNPLRKNGDVVDLARFRKPPPEVTPKESPQEKLKRLAKYLDAKADAGITASQMAHDFLIPEETAEGVLEAVVAKGLLSRYPVSGQTVYRRAPSFRSGSAPATRGPFVQVRSDAEIAEQRERARRVGEEARARAAGARYPVGTVLTLKGGRRRYAVAKVEPRYGDVQTYLLVALSGGEAGSVPSGVREDEVRRHPDQSMRWEGVHARHLQQKFVTYSGIGETGDAARAAYARAGEMVRGSGPIHVDPGVGLINRLRPLRRHAKVSLAPGGRKKGVAYVTVSGWKKDSELRDKLHDAMNRLVAAGLGEHVNSIEAYLGRIIVTAEVAPARNAERVWAELARVSENAELRGNPRKPSKGRRRAMQVQAYLFPPDKWSPARAQAWARKYRHAASRVTEDPDGYIRLTQHSPSDYQRGTLHRVEVAKNVEAIVGIPRTESDAASARGYNKRGPRQGRLFSSAGGGGSGVTDDDILF